MKYFEIISEMTIEDRNQFLTHSQGKPFSIKNLLDSPNLHKIMKEKGLRYSNTLELQNLVKSTKGFGNRLASIL
jgi:hypothetical protein